MPKIRFPENTRSVLSTAMKDAGVASMRQVGKFIETARAVDGIITVDVSPDAGPTIARLVCRMRWPVHSTILHEAGDEILFVQQWPA